MKILYFDLFNFYDIIFFSSLSLIKLSPGSQALKTLKKIKHFVYQAGFHGPLLTEVCISLKSFPRADVQHFNMLTYFLVWQRECLLGENVSLKFFHNADIFLI